MTGQRPSACNVTLVTFAQIHPPPGVTFVTLAAGEIHPPTTCYPK